MPERYRSRALNALLEKLLIDGAIGHKTALLARLIDEGVLRGATAGRMAPRFYSPVFYLPQKFDMRYDKLYKAKDELHQSFAEFFRTHGGRMR